MLPRALIRFSFAALVPVLCTACANEPNTKVLGYQATAQSLSIAPASAAPATGSLPQGAAGLVPARKSMADKVLTAIALERVTGRKPDPARLVETH